MPTYDYRCAECSDVFEVVHAVDEQVESCPRCGGRVRRVFHPVGIIFKGSGFYKTDSRKASDNGGKKDWESAAAEPEKSAAKASDD